MGIFRYSKVFHSYLIIPHLLLHQPLIRSFASQSLENHLIRSESVAGQSKLANIALEWKSVEVHGAHELYVRLQGVDELDQVVLLLHSEAGHRGHSVEPLQLLEVVDVEVWGPDILYELLIDVHAGLLGRGEIEPVILPDEGHEHVDVDGEVPFADLVDLHQEHLGVNVDRLEARQVHLVVVSGQAHSA